MCGTCGCGQDDKVSLTSWPQSGRAGTMRHPGHHHHDPAHHHDHGGHHHHAEGDEHDHIHTEIALEQHADRLSLEVSLLSHNTALAEQNRQHFQQQGVVMLNLMSGPGAGKTALLEAVLPLLMSDMPCAVIEGDQATAQDALRIERLGVPVAQINTGKACHLEASMVQRAAATLPIQPHSLLFVENVGNLVCPAMFDLGEAARIAVLSVTEGEDKPIKYPHLFRGCDLVLINKVDLLPYLRFDMAACEAYLRQVCPQALVMPVSAWQPATLESWIDWLQALQANAHSAAD